jgi:hypothetical protein
LGSSGSYGGTSGQQWNQVRDLFDAVAPDAPAGGDDEAVDDADPAAGSSPLSSIGAALADALAGDDADLTVSTSAVTLAALLPRVRGASGGGGGSSGASGVRGEGSGSGRTGGASKRSVARSASRGGAVLGSGYALRSGDRQALAGVGLDLDELRGLGPRSQCARILDAVLGGGGHPDETALRIAAAEQLKAIIMRESPPSEADALRGFIAAFVFQLFLIELRSELTSGTIDADMATKKEARIRRYLERRVARLNVATAGTMSIADFSGQANRLVREAIDLLRAR